MIDELGQFALILALCLSLAQVALSVAGRLRRDVALAGAGEGAAMATTPCPSRKRSGSSPLNTTGELESLSATTKSTSPSALRTTLPVFTRPPS